MNQLMGTITHDDLIYTEKALAHSISSFSYSRISLWYTCSLQWATTYVLKVKSVGSSKAIKRGEDLHEFYEILNKTPQDTDEYKTVMNEFRKKYPIESLKFTKSWLPHRDTLPKGNLEFFERKMDMNLMLANPHRNVKLIGYLDYLNINNPMNSIIIDFKSGQYTKDPHYADQAAMYAYFVFNSYPQVNNITTYLYDVSDNLERNIISENSFEFVRSRDLDNLKHSLSKMIGEIIIGVQKQKFLATPCRNCRYCPLVTCKFNKSPKNLNDKKVTASLDNAVATVPSVTDTISQSQTVHAINNDSGDIGIKEFFGFTTVGEKEKNLLLELKKSLEKSKKVEDLIDEPKERQFNRKRSIYD